MKKFFLLSVLLLFSISCSSQKEFINNDDFCDFSQNIDKVNKSLTISKEEEDLFLKGNIILLDNDTINSVLYKHPTYKTITNKQTNKQTNIDKMLVYEDGRLIGSYFQYIKGFLNIGMEIEYDGEGNIIKTIDHRQADKYPICFKEAIAIAEKKKNKKDSILSISRDSILYNKKHYYWSVYVKQPNPKNSNREGKTWSYRIDATTGKLIKKVSAEANPG
ncbi:PepSY domain-containing protein [Aquimarina algiphila]|uniref:PepSY domain-containing protein n=1 Tax=Aquimarina algiphila TaxID=2047982 RepID=UPI00232A846A|nr:PepSY domain-containing protein [Aquimarina algiphila]